MKKIEKMQVAKVIAAQCTSLSEISKRYSELRETISADVAKEIINFAKDYKRADFAKVDEKKAVLIESITGERVLRAVFKEIQKDRAYKDLANRAYCKAGSVSELVSRWYPDTIDGEPARRVWNEDKTARTWELKPITRANAASILIACIRNVAKGAKRQTTGTTAHKAGEVIETAEAQANS